MKFNSTRNIFQSIYNLNSNNENEINNLKKFTYSIYSNTFSRKLNIINIDTTPIYYDLYNFKGTTFVVGETPPEPLEVYKEVAENQWEFFYPIWGFPVPSGETPEDYSFGANPWEFHSSIAIIKTKIEFSLFPDWIVNGSKVISYLTTEDSSIIGEIKTVILAGGVNIDEISIKFSEFYRWIKLENGYNFEYYAIYPIINNQQLTLNSKLYIYNPKNNYYGQSEKI